MNKIKFLYTIIIVLVLLNIGVVSFFLLSKPTPPPHPSHGKGDSPKEVIIDRLEFDNNQKDQLEKLIQQHRESIMEKDRKIKEYKTALFQSLATERFENSDSLMVEINKIQLDIERLHYQHFKDLKGICKPNQIEKFNDLTSEFGRLFHPRPKPPKH